MPRHTRESLAALGVKLPPPILNTLTPIRDPEASPTAAETGREAQKLGRLFEAALQTTHEAWKIQGRAEIDRMPVDHGPAPKTVKDVSGRLPQGILRVLRERQGFDYQGVVAGGRSIAIEAKASSKGKPSLEIGNRGIKPHQLERLAVGWARFGRIPAIVWLNGDQRLILMPEAIVEAFELYRSNTRKSVPIRVWDGYEVTNGLEDYLTPLMERING